MRCSSFRATMSTIPYKNNRAANREVDTKSAPPALQSSTYVGKVNSAHHDAVRDDSVLVRNFSSQNLSSFSADVGSESARTHRPSSAQQMVVVDDDEITAFLTANVASSSSREDATNDDYLDAALSAKLRHQQQNHRRPVGFDKNLLCSSSTRRTAKRQQQHCLCDLRILLPASRRIVGAILFVFCVIYLLGTILLPMQFHLFPPSFFAPSNVDDYVTTPPRRVELEYFPPHDLVLGAHKISLINLSHIHPDLATSIDHAVLASSKTRRNQVATNHSAPSPRFDQSQLPANHNNAARNTTGVKADVGLNSHANKSAVDTVLCEVESLARDNNMSSSANALNSNAGLCARNASAAQPANEKHRDALIMLLKHAGLHDRPLDNNTTCSTSDKANGSFDRNTSHPNIIHYIRYFSQLKDAELNFLQFTSIISAERLLQPDMIYIYSNIEPHGYYYDLAKRFTRCLQYQHIDRIAELSGKRVEHIEHEADYNKVYQVYQRGGVFLDFDAFFINTTSLRAVQSKHECVLACESGCSIVNAGFISCQKESPYMALWLEGYTKHFNPAGWVYNSGIYPTGILNEHKYNRSLVLLDDRISQNPQWNEKWRWIESNKKGVSEWNLKPAAHHFLKWHELQERLAMHSDLELILMKNGLGTAIRHIFRLSDNETSSLLL